MDASDGQSWLLPTTQQWWSQYIQEKFNSIFASDYLHQVNMKSAYTCIHDCYIPGQSLQADAIALQKYVVLTPQFFDYEIVFVCPVNVGT